MTYEQLLKLDDKVGVATFIGFILALILVTLTGITAFVWLWFIPGISLIITTGMSITARLVDYLRSRPFTEHNV